ncbi:hypothetical protein EYZ11_002251 [Aspergillus tanneri]|uniref:Uncharacterized protein n=1 Tax=Aspergillus tanneri TaxID=1220188 RepID=A0A4S3JR69_9EURO|nr:hypothetical protein EYZ11_002251 [Aspergillus tanneri]
MSLFQASLLEAISHPSIPPHLQATLPQVLFPHRPILDLLPWPGLRVHAIMLAATVPMLHDALDFKKDIIEGGLVCSPPRRGAGALRWEAAAMGSA